MGWTKRQFVAEAFREIGLPLYVFSIKPEQMQGALTALDALVASWQGVALRIGYPINQMPGEIDPDTETGVPDWCNLALYTGLAIRIAPGYGKTVSPDTKSAHAAALEGIQILAARPSPWQRPGGVPVGAGNKPWSTNFRFTPPPPEDLGADPDGTVEL